LLPDNVTEGRHDDARNGSRRDKMRGVKFRTKKFPLKFLQFPYLGGLPSVAD